MKDFVSKIRQPDGSFRKTHKREGHRPAPSASKERVGTHLRRLIDRLVEIKSTGTCRCKTLAAEMDRWGAAGCRDRRELIVSRLVENRQMLIDALKKHESSFMNAAGAVIDAAPLWLLKKGAEILVDRAIQSAIDDFVKTKPARTLGSNRIVRRSGDSRRSIGSAFRYMGGEVRFIKASQFQEDILKLVGKIPHDVTAIAGVARSGLSAATMVAMYLHRPMFTIRQTLGDIIPSGNGWRLGGDKHIDPSKNKIAIIDDTVMTGNSIKAIRPIAHRYLGENILFCSVYCNPLALVKPDIHAVDLGWPHLLEWNLFNSILSPVAAMDFDGILCRDCEPWQDDDGDNYRAFIENAVPLYVPRRVTVPLIVTARIEKYRQITEQWLMKHGIRWNRLIMHPASTLAERNRDDIAAYKARHFVAWAKKTQAAPGPIMFIESCDWQARRIGAISKMLCVCPATAGCYGGIAK